MGAMMKYPSACAVFTVLALCSAAPGAEDPAGKLLCFLMSGKEAGSTTLLAVDDDFDLRYFVTKPEAGTELAATARSRFAAADPFTMTIIDDTRLSIVVKVSPFAISATSTNRGYAFTVKRKDDRIAKSDIALNVFTTPDGGTFAIFLISHARFLPHTVEELGNFDAAAIRRLIGSGDASIRMDGEDHDHPIP